MGSKLGIVFAFILSIAAAGGSYYLYQGWVEERTVRAGVEAKYDQVKEKMVAVQSEKEELQAKSEEYRTKAEAMQGQLEKLQAEQSRIDSEKTALENQLKEHQGLIANLQKQVGELAQKAKEAQAACGVTPADLNTGAPAEPFQGVASAVSAVTSSTEQTDSKLVFKPVTSSATVAPATFGEAQTPAVTESVSSTPAASPAAEPAPAVSAPVVPAEPSSSTVAPAPASAPETVKPADAPAAAATSSAPKVLTVNRKFNFVVINQGMQDGLKMGDKLKVLKQGQESATIQVEKLYDKFSAATLVEEDPKQQVLEGDEIRKV